MKRGLWYDANFDAGLVKKREEAEGLSSAWQGGGLCDRGQKPGNQRYSPSCGCHGQSLQSDPSHHG